MLTRRYQDELLLRGAGCSRFGIGIAIAFDPDPDPDPDPDCDSERFAQSYWVPRFRPGR